MNLQQRSFEKGDTGTGNKINPLSDGIITPSPGPDQNYMMTGEWLTKRLEVIAYVLNT